MTHIAIIYVKIFHNDFIEVVKWSERLRGLFGFIIFYIKIEFLCNYY